MPTTDSIMAWGSKNLDRLPDKGNRLALDAGR